MEGVFLYDIDDLEGIVEENLKERQAVAEEVELIIEAEIVSFKQWLNTLGVVPVISALREKALTIQAETMQSIGASFSSASASDANSFTFKIGSRKSWLIMLFVCLFKSFFSLVLK